MGQSSPRIISMLGRISAASMSISFDQGKPVDNAHIESFNGRLRDECLNAKWFESLDDARKALQAWRWDYNEVRPHSSLGDMPPSAFAAQIQGVAPALCSQDREEEHQAGPTKGSGSKTA